MFLKKDLFQLFSEDAVAKGGTEYQLPFRLIDPHDVLVPRGQSATLTCKTESIQITKFEYKWYFNGSEILQNLVDDHYEDDDGKKWQLRENGSLLYIPKITLNSLRKYEGYYQCFVKIKNTDKGLLSNPAKLSVASKLINLTVF